MWNDLGREHTPAVAATLALCLLAALASLAPAPPLAAQEAAPLYVAFDFGDYPAAAALFDAADGAWIVDHLVAELGKDGKLPYWRFEAAGDGDYPRLAVRIEEQTETGDYELVATLHASAGDGGQGSWHGRFLPFEQLAESDGFPAPSRVPQLVVDAFADHLLTRQRVNPDDGEMFLHLKERVPVAEGARLQKGRDRGVVALDATRHSRLMLSTFRLDCRRQGGDVVSLYSKGTGSMENFSEPPTFPAIVVHHDRWQEGPAPEPISQVQLDELDSLAPRRVYLEQYDLRAEGLTGSSAGGDGGTALPPPSVAPVPADASTDGAGAASREGSAEPDGPQAEEGGAP